MLENPKEIYSSTDLANDLAHVISVLGDVLAGLHDVKPKKGNYWYQSWEDVNFCRWLSEVRFILTAIFPQRKDFSFLDVGCGIGLKVLLASKFFARADGVEFEAGYAETAAKVLTF